MKTPLKSLLVLGLFATYSHAIFGIGGHFGLVPGLEVKASKGVIAQGVTHTLSLDERGLSGIQGFGAKFWIDFLPLVDIEAAGTLQFGYYDVSLSSTNPTLEKPVSFDLGVPGVEGKPFFARALGDVAVLYPFFKFPPLIKLIKVYAGGGLSYGVAAPILSPAFAKKALDSDPSYDPNTDNDNSKAAKIIVDAIKAADFEKGIGFFLQLGAHAKLPIIPIAAYADLKYRVPGIDPALVDGSGWNMELGGALAF